MRHHGYQGNHRSGSRNPFKKRYIAAGLLLLPIFGYLKYKGDIEKPVDPSDKSSVSFQIPKGSGVKSIAADLEDKDLIDSSTSFYWYTRLNNLDQNILAGRFTLNRGMTVPQILQSLSNPAEAQAVITIQEGLSIKAIDEKLTAQGLIGGGDFVAASRAFDGWEYYPFLDKAKLQTLENPLEGYLYPDTYFLDTENFEAKDLIYLALDNFERKLSELNLNGQSKSLHELVTMGSIIEREVFGSKDRRIVSGIFWKRLEAGWRLDADASLLYVTDDNKITASELELDSPYNTRKNGGLPPGPICSPSIDSIKAAMNPEISNYWFYLTTLDTGEVIYAESNEDHNLNKANHLY